MDIPVKYSTDPKVRELQERALALGKQVGTETKLLELETEKAWEAKTKPTKQMQMVADIFVTPSEENINADGIEPIPF